jgi:hypothetical protein
MAKSKQPTDAIQHLARTRKLTLRIFLLMVLGFFLMYGVFGFVKRSVDPESPNHGGGSPLVSKDFQGRR